ncbi:MAG: OmpA family protein [Granulosicoccus sp.]
MLSRSGFLIGCLAISGCSSIANDAGFRSSLLTSPFVPYKWTNDTQRDSDFDGVADHADTCEETPRNTFVGPAGCEIVTGVIEGLKFAPDEVELSVKSRIVLGKLVDGLTRYPSATFSVEGHTDNRGSAADNLKLSKKRVNAVVSFMVEQGVGAEQIKPFAFGESRPREPNATLEGRERNRRIEIEIIKSLL